MIALKNFLAFARTGILQQPYSTGKEPDTPFEEAVIKALAQNNIEVEPQVGTAGFFIDIAVKDRESPGRYIMGIECDGATYHSSRSARDRDRLRQEVLEGLGWRLHRIWSTDWYRNPAQELARTLAAIEKARFDYQSGVITQAPKVMESTGTTQIARDASAQHKNESHSFSVPYKRAVLYIDLGNRELHEIPVFQLLPSILKVVEQESPIHKSELIRRITEGAGLKRSGSRIQAAVQSAINMGVRDRKLTQKGDLIWDPNMTVPPVRDRSDLDATEKKFEFVAPEEIRLALHKSVEIGFSLSEEDAISSAARLLGFQRVTSQAKLIFSNQVRLLIAENVFDMRNGFLTLL